MPNRIRIMKRVKARRSAMRTSTGIEMVGDLFRGTEPESCVDSVIQGGIVLHDWAWQPLGGVYTGCVSMSVGVIIIWKNCTK